MSLTLAEARAYVDKGLIKAEQLNVRVCLAVVDQFGQLVQMDRMDGAPLMSPDIAEAKALTALNFGRPTSGVEQLFQANPDRIRSMQQAAHYTMLVSPGGVPIFRGGMRFGAIGVSGATGEQDEEIANEAVS